MKASRTISEFLPTVSDLLDGRQASEEDALGLGIEVGSEAGISPGALMRPALGVIGPPMAFAGTPRQYAADDALDLVESELQSFGRIAAPRSEEHTSELQSLMRISYAVFCLTKKKKTHINQNTLC